MFEDIKKAQLVQKIRVMAVAGQSGEEIKKSLSKEELDLMKSFSNDIEKGKAAQVGEIRVWQGKKMRKQANGKWVEVSESGMSRRDILDKIDNIFKLTNFKNKKDVKESSRLSGGLRHSADQLSDKEYDESELSSSIDDKIKELKEEKEKYEKERSKLKKQYSEGMGVQKLSDIDYLGHKISKIDEKIKDLLTKKSDEGKKRDYDEYKKSGGRKSLANAIIDGDVEDDTNEYTKEQMEEKIYKLNNYNNLVDKVANHYNVSREKVSKLKLDGTDTPLELSRALGLHLNDTNFSGVNDTIKKLSKKNKDLENKLSELIDKENFYEKVAEHFGEPDDDGESESALIDRILSHGEEKVKKFIDSLK